MQPLGFIAALNSPVAAAPVTIVQVRRRRMANDFEDNLQEVLRTGSDGDEKAS